MGNPTYRQIADLAKVSLSTVSLALRNHPSIPEPTRRRIRRVALRNGYQENPVVATLMSNLRASRTRQTEKIAFLTFWGEREQWLNHENTRRQYDGACRRARQLGYEIEHFWAKEPGMSNSELSEMLRSAGVRGIVASPLMVGRGHLSLEWENFAIVLVGYSILRPAMHRVTHAHYGGIQTALRQLRHCDYDRIGFAIQKTQNERVDNLWLAGYLAFAFTLPLSCRVAPLIMASLEKDELQTWIRKEKPDAVVTNQCSLLSLIQEIGLNIGFANLDLQAGERAMAGIDQRADQLGALAVDIVVRQLQGNEFGIPGQAVIHQVEGSWRDGSTVREASRNSHGKSLAESRQIVVPLAFQ